ncbi:MAG TPA: LON peptidase substrate-binding domain-containing protein [Methylomirabilota bacterium]|nr:LON peptidase substrate-binding domain-containing protein [Methylomirabilota bacterium]
MDIPSEIPVMTLPNATLFPQALLPLYIFEPRYRKMLADALRTHRMFSVAMQKPGRKREMPSPVAGLGLIRVSVDNRDGTSHLILQGMTRIELNETVRYKPYRIQRIRPIVTPPSDSVMVDALIAKVRELVRERIENGVSSPLAPFASSGVLPEDSPPGLQQASSKDMLRYLDEVQDPDQLADLVSCALLPNAIQRQTLLETIEIERRLKRLVQFLMGEIQRLSKGGSHGA